ncbi:hypothetical protein EJ069_13715 [Mesorhizobium sp. M2A.F.Ca.ET.043.05.1.1]|uniref:hypothetical protein n=1 Tax=unclassified Mesorhizobium TaxID=325217 RepID=UPI000F75E574|nr:MULTISPECIES: hypothetical protein [unclassified Mesorhizobium]AZO15683.1 hypothetical protein EJ069_13715 [Mesorhizobium sp. M2A.F.Ca.ET.043.05.1.1]RWD65476.1 MAG: hypothetical protein EOS37_25920 [Mesorhizobium sp.]TGS10525.1 hypothetical protein EN852_025605 [Mesorhizobium sp. M2E.F.Ca.ET.209.01.1.1]TIV79417.1 MAG: hypothetical protein E5V93_09275 [Mesorhizobium sp.]TIW27825.1 MAG: hypothetical protein E5V81_04135 [Mesorhizobium sp.]
MRRREALQAGSGRAPVITQAEITRALKAAQAADLKVFSYVITKTGVRVITSPIETPNETDTAANPWDRFLSDGKAE